MGRVQCAHPISPIGFRLGNLQAFSSAGLPLLLVSALLLCLPGTTSAQTVTVQPPVLVQGNKTYPSSLFRPDETIRLQWSPVSPGMQLKIGDFPGEYRRLSVPVSNLASFDFKPGDLSLPVGIYHAVLTTATQAQTQAEIRAAARNDASLVYSSDFTLVVEAPTAPVILGPRGTIFTSTPTFTWEGIPGVPAYIVAISSTPFEIGTDPETNDPVVKGLSPVWGALTTETSARYGQPSPETPLPNLPAPPLIPGKEYYYTVINAYSKSDISLVSEAFAGIVAFRYEAFTGLLAPTLVRPEDGATFVQEPTIIFEWEPVSGAASYTFTLAERQIVGGSTGDVPIYTITTPATSLELDALRLLRTARYTWSVIPNEPDGSAGLPSQRTFEFEVPMGTFRFRPVSSLDGSPLIGTRVSVENLDGGNAPLVPMVNTSASYPGSLVVGRYLFHASRTQYADTSVAVTIRENELSEFQIPMRPLPARLSGRVADGGGTPLENAVVEITGAGGSVQSGLTDSDGRFSFSLSPGTYAVSARRDGYAEASVEGVAVEPDGQVELPEPLILRAVAGFVSGRVVNESGQAVQLARITATSGTRRQTAVSDGEGGYDFILAAGLWTLSGEKEGFLGGRSIQLAVAAGEQISGITVVLTERASQVNGTVFGISKDAEGRPSRRVLSGATVEAVPTVGPVLTARSDDLGRFVLDLGAGSYTIRGRRAGYLASERLDVRLGLSQSLTGLELELQQATTVVDGRVVTPSGAPVPGARVWLDLEYEGSIFVEAGSDGRYELFAPAGAHRLTATAPGYAQNAVQVGLTEGGRLSGVVIVLSPGAARVSGRVSRSGVPIPRPIVTASNGGETRMVRGADDGSYLINLPAGSWTLQASANGHLPSQAVPLAVQAGQSVEGINFELLAQQAILTGGVTSNGVPVAGASIRITGGARPLATLSRGDGLFSVSVSPGLPLVVRVERGGFVPQTVSVAALNAAESRSLSIELSPVAASVAGTVRSSQGSALAGATVTALQDGQAWSAQSGFDGSYLLALQPGSYELRVSRTGYEVQTRAITLAIGERRSGVDFSLVSATGSIQVRVLETTGAAIQAAEVTVEGPDGVRSGRTDADGRSVFEMLPPGSYTARAAFAGRRSASSGTLTLAAGLALEETLILSRLNGGLSGTIRTQDDNPVSGALVRAVGEGVQALSAADGSFVLSGLTPGSVTLEVSAPGFAVLRLTDISVGSEIEGLGVLRLTRLGGRLAGIVTDQTSGAGIADALVTLKGSAGTSSVRTGADGAYVIADLADGEYQLSVTAPGYRGTTQTIVIPQQSTADVSLTLSDGRISGRVSDPLGQPLPFPVRVVASSSSQLAATTTDSEGRYQVTGLDPGQAWTLRTDINRLGYVNALVTADFPAGANNLQDVDLTVSVETASIAGNAGIAGASVRLQRPPAGAIRSIVQSRPNGEFSFSQLPPGAWRVVPERSGVTFTPAFVDLNLSQGQAATATFSAVSSVGGIEVLVLNALRQPIAATSVVLSSTDGLIVRSGLTSGAGLITFPDLPLARTYVVRPSRFGFSSSPASAELTLTVAGTLRQTFVLSEATGVLSGSVRDESGGLIQQATLSAIHQESGILYTASTSEGRYRMERLPGGTYTVTANSDGFRSVSRTTALGEGEQQTGFDFTLRLASVILQGRVLYQGRGVLGASVTASAARSLQTQTDGSGLYVFPALPLDRPAPDSTVYQMTATTSTGASRSITVRIPGERLGQVVSAPDIVLSSGRITVDVDNGLSPLPGTSVRIERPSGGVLEGMTDANGAYTTQPVLGPGIYSLDIDRPGYLKPTGPPLSVVLENETSAVTAQISMPFRHDAPPFISTIDPTGILIQVTPGYDDASVVAHLVYRGSGSQVSLTMTRELDGFRAQIPPLLTAAPVTYHVEVLDAASGITWRSRSTTITPQAPGVLTSVRLQPSLTGARVRTGDTYHLDLVPRDGVGTSLADRFSGVDAGSVEWTLTGPAGSLTLPDPGSPLRANLTVTEPGDYQLVASVVLSGKRLTITPEFSAGDFQPERLTLSVPSPTVNNQSPGVQMGYLAESSDGGSQLLGSALSWSVSPSAAGTITSSGFFTPSDAGFIGPVTVEAQDEVSRRSGRVVFNLYRRLAAGDGADLHDGQGTQLLLLPGTLPFAADIGLSHPPLVGPKRDATPVGTSNRYTAGERLVRFSMRSDRALLNDSLLIPARLRLPADPSLSLFASEATVGRFDLTRLRWRLERSEPDQEGVVAPEVTRLGEFGTLVPNQGLGLDHVAVLPNPFSPMVGPLRIGYFLTTNEPPATVTIRVFNVRGELVRTLLSNESQEPGRYGSRSSRLELVWDGLTDAGTQARNGRYIIEIRASDASGTTTERISVVLVK